MAEAHALRARRHPNKSGWWKCKAYWGIIQGRQDRWVFMDKVSGTHLIKLSWISIKRHHLIKGNASPDNPNLQEYWKTRQATKVKSLSNSQIRIRVWSEQKGLCLACKQPLDNNESVALQNTAQLTSNELTSQIKWLLIHQECWKLIKAGKCASIVSKLLEPNAG